MRNACMVRSPHDSSFSFSKRHFQWIMGKVRSSAGDNGEGEYEELEAKLTTNGDSSSYDQEPVLLGAPAVKNKKSSSSTAAAAAVTKFRSVLTMAVTGKSRPTKVTGTLYGHRRSHVHLAFQFNSKSARTVLLEIAMPTSSLVKEMAAGPLRIALKCERKGSDKPTSTLLEETTLWRAYCNGKKCGYAARREIGVEDLKVLKAVEPVSMGAGVLPGTNYGGDGEGEIMYMRARFERVVGSKNSEALYMINPVGNSGPELSVFLLRV